MPKTEDTTSLSTWSDSILELDKIKDEYITIDWETELKEIMDAAMAIMDIASIALQKNEKNEVLERRCGIVWENDENKENLKPSTKD